MLLLKIICNLCLTVCKSQSNVLHMNEIKVDQGTPLLHMRGIEKIFPGVKALDGVDLDVRAGEVHCLLGQNGAGKSTMIKDRKSTRLNSSHVAISYAVFC